MSTRARTASSGVPGLGLTAFLAAVATVLSAAAGPAPAAAQAREPGDGWLGVGLISFTECLEGPGAPEDECRHRLVVGGLVHGGPAARAGLQPGDTLLAVDGDRLGEGVEDPGLARMSAGDTVSLLVGRQGGRVRLRAVSTSRPDSLAIVQYHDDGAYGVDRVRYLLSVPRRPVLDSLVSSAEGEPNAAVLARVSVVPAERVRKIPLESAPSAPGRLTAEMREELRELRARARELRRTAVREARTIRQELAEAPEAAARPGEEWKRWVAEELQPRLQVIYDSVLAEARDRMDSLGAAYPAGSARSVAVDSLRAAARQRGTPVPPGARDAGVAPDPGPPPSPEELGMPGNRIGGAELQPLNPGLAEFFGGVERGLVVLQVLEGTPAARLGLRPGDVIVEAAGSPVARLEGLRRALVEQSDVEIRWVRRGEVMADTLRH